jgi:YVTN family beta-propeller protein
MTAHAKRTAVGISVAVLLTGCTPHTASRSSSTTARTSRMGASETAGSGKKAAADLLPGMPAPLNPTNVYAADGPNMLSAAVADDPAYLYVPNSISNTVSVINQHTFKVIATFPGGQEPQHVVPSYDLKTLYVTADWPGSGSLTPINPATGKPGRQIRIDDVYNMYFTPDGTYAIAVQEAYARLAFYNPHSWRLHDSLTIQLCKGIDHLDFTADGEQMLASCEFSNRLAVIDTPTHQLVKTVDLHHATGGMPQDVKLSPDGAVFYVADIVANGIYVIDAATFRVSGFIATGNGAHGLYIARDSKRMFITNRDAGSVSVLDLASRRATATWRIPGGGSPDMGNISANGKVLWLSGRYDGVVYAMSTVNGHLLAKIKVDSGPHGLTVWPLPGRYSLGHTGILR